MSRNEVLLGRSEPREKNTTNLLWVAFAAGRFPKPQFKMKFESLRRT